MDVSDGAGRGSATTPPECADRIMTDEYTAGIAAQGIVPGCEQTIENLEVVGHECSLVLPERIEETLWSSSFYNTAFYNTVSQNLPP